MQTTDGSDDDFVYDDPDVRYDTDVALEALRVFVKSALDGSSESTSRYYELLDACGRATTSTDEADGAAALLDALSGHATMIDERKHEQLVSMALLKVDLWACEVGVRAMVLKFATQLVCAQGGAFIGAVVGKLVESFNAPFGREQWWKIDESDDRGDGAALAHVQAGDVVIRDLTRCLGNILRLVPQSSRAVTHALREGVPHKSAPKEVQIGFIRAALILIESADGVVLRDDFLKVIVGHLLEVDVEIKWDDVVAGVTSGERGDGHEEEEDDDAIFELDDIEKSIEEQCRAEWEQRPTTSAPLAVDEAADTLDALMELTLAHVNKRMGDGEMVLVRRALMHAFKVTLLPAPRSKFVQFLVFHMCSRDEQACRELTEELFTTLTDVSAAGSLRLAAAAYFASFLARAKHLTPDFVCDMLKRLVDWCASHVKQKTTPGSAALSGAQEKTVVGMPPPEPHQTLAVFDSACQAMMYVLCYRAEGILHTEGSAAMTLRALPLCEVLYSHLRPLHTCLPSVVTEFLHRAVAAGMNGFTGDLLREHMDRVATGRETDVSSMKPLSRQPSMEFTSKQVSTTSRNRFPLRMFFPFDPYLLRRSAELLQLHETYVFWTGSEADRPVGSEDDDMQLSSQSESESESSSEEDDPLNASLSSRSGVSDQARSFGVGSLNTRPRKKVFLGLRQPRPLFGRRDGSPHSPKGTSGPSPSPGAANGFAAMAARYRQRGGGGDPESVSPHDFPPPRNIAKVSTPPRVTSFRVKERES